MSLTFSQVFVALLVLLVALMILTSPRRKNMKEIRDKQLQDQILRLFIPGRKYLGLQVAELLRQRTSGEKNIPDVVVHHHLGILVNQGDLVMDTYEVKIQEFSVDRIEYFLPEKKE